MPDLETQIQNSIHDSWSLDTDAIEQFAQHADSTAGQPQPTDDTSTDRARHISSNTLGTSDSGDESDNRMEPIEQTETAQLPLATHESGAELYGSMLDNTIIVTATQTVSVADIELSVTTHSDTFYDTQIAGIFIMQVTEGIVVGELAIDAFALVPHDGSSNLAEEHARDGATTTASLLQADNGPGLADVFAVVPDELPSAISMDHVHENADELIQHLYSPSESPDAVTEILSLEQDEIDGDELDIHVYTVTEDDVQ